MKFSKKTFWLAGALSCLWIAGCSIPTGPDAVSEKKAKAAVYDLNDCLDCHTNSTLTFSIASISTNSNHLVYVSSGANTCSACHFGYQNSNNHFNGIRETISNNITACLACHANLNKYDPLVTGGLTTNGRHYFHQVQTNKLCTDCHFGYATNATHLDGLNSALDSNVIIVRRINTTSTRWTGDTGPQTGNCTIMCHTARPWYAP